MGVDDLENAEFEGRRREEATQKRVADAKVARTAEREAEVDD